MLGARCLETQGLGSADMRIVVPTCDKYVDIIPLMLGMLWDTWPDHGYPIDVVYTNKEPSAHGRLVRTVSVGDDGGWVNNMLKYLNFDGIDDLILLLLDDYMLVDVHTDFIESALRQFDNNAVAAVRLVPTPGPTLPWDGELIGEIDKRAQYSVSLQATIWRRDALKTLLAHLEEIGCISPWCVEIRGSEELHKWQDIGHILCLTKGAVGYVNYYRRGVIAPEAKRIVERRLGV